MAENKPTVPGKIKEKGVKKNNKNFKRYKVEKDTENDGENGRDVYVVFDDDTTTANCSVEKLKIKDSGLSTTGYIWYSFFNVKKGTKNLEKSDGITYSVYVDANTFSIAYFDGSNYGTKTAVDEDLPADWFEDDTARTMKKITFDTGDPAIGITT